MWSRNTARSSRTHSGRSHAGSRSSSSAAVCRACSRASFRSRRRPASTSTRSASRSASSPGSPLSTSPRWSRCGCGATPSPAATLSYSSPPSGIRPPRSAGQLLKEAGLPDGVFNVVQGDKEAVDALLHHPDIAAVCFVGSTPDCASTSTSKAPRRETLFRRSAAPRTTWSSCPMQTSRWRPTPRFGVTAPPASVAWRFPSPSRWAKWRTASSRRSSSASPRSKVGDGLDPASEMGPLVTGEHRDRVASYVENAAAEGATVVVDGRERSRQ